MKAMKTYYIIVAAALITACANKVLKQAENQYKHEQYLPAAQNYEQALRDNPEENDPKIMLRLADCYRQMNRYAEAEKWYSRAISSPEATAEDKLHYAEVLKAQGKCEEANAMLDEYLHAVPADSVAKKMKQSCSMPFEKADGLYTVKKMEFGRDGSCFSPVRMGNNLLITASAKTGEGAPVDNRTGKGFYDLCVVSAKDGHSMSEEPSRINTNSIPSSEIKQGGGPSVPDAGATTEIRNENNFPADSFIVTDLPGVNSAYHEGAAVISSAGDHLYFTRSKMSNNQPIKTLDNINHLELCEAELVDGSWTNIKPLPFNNNKEYSVGHPALSPDGNRLYFISDKPGGYGGTDIYYSDFAANSWSKPVNAGANINTAGNEMFPVIRKVEESRQVLYFSSNGWPGDGGLDIFKAEIIDSLPGKAERLRSPFNSTHDDFGICYNDDGISGYFSSNRDNDEGTDNIYAFKRNANFFYVDAKVYYATNGEPVTDKEVEIKIMKKNPSGTELDTMVTDSLGGIFFPADSMTVYSFAVREEGYFAAVGTADIKGFDGKLRDTVHLKLYMNPIVINKPIRLDNIYYDFDKWNIRPDAAVELDKLVKIMKDNPNIKVELGSHCDCRGKDAYNMRLSQRRAQAAVDYIVSKGISSYRITAKGYGESVLLNKCSDGVQCTEQEHQLNRRTEFKVTEILVQPAKKQE
jgi:outer membrane protein OmpA-like peptidoglycan-associated protein/tetratricopeptide (TPR) repeat protein